MGIWDIYYSHWAKESNAKRFETGTKKGIEKTIKTLWCWYEMMPLSTIPSLEFRYVQQEFVERMTLLGTMLREVDGVERLSDNMELLRQMSEYLCPNHLPRRREDENKFQFFVIVNGQLERGEDTPWYSTPPSEARLLQNLGGIYVRDFRLTADDCRRIDAVVALL